jgi:MinD-like ATPase involved in chromosome partitioning or flagellar assembly
VDDDQYGRGPVRALLTEEQLRHRLDAALRAGGVDVAEIVMRADPFGGWRVSIITGTPFHHEAGEPSRFQVPADVDQDISFLEIRPFDDRDGVDDLLRGELSDRPLWPQALARRGATDVSTARFAADLDISLKPPVVTTFYSLRGGVGRSTALGYVARVLARENRVLCVDMDLEAPGLAALFGVEEQVSTGQGVVSLLVQLDLGAEPDLTDHILRIDDVGELYLLPAGLPSAEYARQLAQVDPVGYYQDDLNPLRELLKLIRNSRLCFDVVLLDARTGISPLSAPLLFDLADLAVVAFFPHPQAFRGTGALVEALLRARTERQADGQSLTPSPHFLISPIPGGDSETVERYEDRVFDQLSRWVGGINLADGTPAFDPLRLADITTFVTYSEAVAVSDDILGSGELARPYEPLAEWISGYLPGTEPIVAQSAIEPPADLAAAASPADGPSQPELPRESAMAVALAELPFDGSVAEQQDYRDLRDSFLRTRATDEALGQRTSLVIGRKGTGKTAVFRSLRESSAGNIVVLAPAGLGDPWLLGSNEFELIDGHRRRCGVEWRVVWQVVTALVVSRGLAASPVPPWAALPSLLDPSRDPTATSFVGDVRNLLDLPDIGLLSRDWLLALDGMAPERRFLLYDGLDTGFGHSAQAMVRRADAVAGLLEFVGETGEKIERLRFKVLLREDIWRGVNIPNKSHFFGRSVQLTWSDSTEYLNVAIKRAVRSSAFRALLASAVDENERLLIDVPVDVWPEDMSLRAWRLLTGDRIAGSKTAFTANWVWKRLADANDDHTPRSLIQLLSGAQKREQGLRQQAEQARSVIRPRTLVDSLAGVSSEALIALAEEFSELDPMLDELRQIGQTPFGAEQLPAPDHLRRLAQEVGLLAPVAGTSDQPERYRVPELYRIELRMGRKGQR